MCIRDRITIPTAFQIASSVQETDDVAKLARFAVREDVYKRQALSDVGEGVITYCDSCDFSATDEKAEVALSLIHI